MDGCYSVLVALYLVHEKHERNERNKLQKAEKSMIPNYIMHIMNPLYYYSQD